MSKVTNSDGSVTEKRTDKDGNLKYESVTSDDGSKTSWTEYEDGAVRQRGVKNVNSDGSAEIVTYDPVRKGEKPEKNTETVKS